jgi:Fur family peroxide stress response transcriptional regulator
MIAVKHSPLDEALAAQLEKSGFRPTPQRVHVYRTLRAKRDHPTAEEVFIRAKKDMPDISMATVYNCLDALVQSKLVRLVNHDKGATRYCSNMQEHHHFYCVECGGAFDIDAPSSVQGPILKLPAGFKADRYEIAFRGLCPDCATAKKGK